MSFSIHAKKIKLVFFSNKYFIIFFPMILGFRHQCDRWLWFDAHEFSYDFAMNKMLLQLDRKYYTELFYHIPIFYDIAIYSNVWSVDHNCIRIVLYHFHRQLFVLLHLRVSCIYISLDRQSCRISNTGYWHDLSMDSKLKQKLMHM